MRRPFALDAVEPCGCGLDIELAGSLLPLQNDLKLLPLPFYDAAVNLHPVVPIVFLSQPSAKAMQAAGIMASWFGMLTDYHPVRFPVSLGTIPAGNAIVIGEKRRTLPASLSIGATSGPTMAMRTNPVDPYSKVLVVTGDSADDLLNAAMALALQSDMLHGSQVSLTNVKMPDRRRPDDAPRWLSTDRDRRRTWVRLRETGDLQGDGRCRWGFICGCRPISTTGAFENLGFHLSYRYNGIPLADGSSLQVYMNSAYVSSTPMPHTDKALRRCWRRWCRFRWWTCGLSRIR